MASQVLPKYRTESSDDAAHLKTDANPYSPSDPSVAVNENTPEETKKLWWLHGHPHVERYSDPNLNSLTALSKHNANEHPDNIAFIYPVTDSNEVYKSLTWIQFHEYTNVLAHRYGQALRSELLEAHKGHKQPTVALLGVGVTFDYWATLFALIKLNVRVLFLAERNTVEVFHSLFLRCQAVAVVVDAKNEAVDTNGVRKIPLIVSLPDASNHFGNQNGELEDLRFEDEGDSWEKNVLILHSSGSTGPPKAIVHTNRSLMTHIRLHRLYSEFHSENLLLLFPLYHIAGLLAPLSGLPSASTTSFPPLNWPPAASSLLESWKILKSQSRPIDSIIAPPIIIEMLYDHIVETGGDFTPLSSLKVVSPSGARLSDTVVSKLASEGVNVKTTYGSTETGLLLRTTPGARDNKQCNSGLRLLFPDNDKFEMQNVGDALYECVIYKGFQGGAELWDDKPSNEPHRMGDLFRQEPPGSGYFTIFGRRDDLLVLSNGENVAAGEIQLRILAGDPILKNVLMVGHTRPCVCLLVELKDHALGDDALLRIWEGVRKVNLESPRYSRVLRSMIHVLPKETRLPTTPKGNVKRNDAVKEFADVIDKLYRSLKDDDNSNQMNIDHSLPARILDAVATASGLPGSTLDPSATFYELGIDSLGALQLRSLLSKYLGPFRLGLIYEHPSVNRLVAHFQKDGGGVVENKHFSFIHHTISSYSSEFACWAAPSKYSKDYQDGEHVLLTGVSGNLGTALLEIFVASPHISRIYALVHGPKGYDKLKSALEMRQMDTAILESGKVEVFDYSMKDSLLGLDMDTYYRLSKEVTTVVHDAWRVDFNQSVQDFEADCLRGSMYLMRFCFAGTLKVFAFISSVSTCMGDSGDQDIFETPAGDDAGVAMKIGYAQSKYIVERITQTASQQLHMPCKIFRVGQLCGHSLSGHWSEHDMYPIMFATSVHLNAIPAWAEHSHVDWVPMDVAARTITETLTQQSQELYTVYHVVNPHSTSWSELVRMLQDSLHSSVGRRMDVVSMQEWTRQLYDLAARGEDVKHVPGLRLLHFFENIAAEGDSQPSRTFMTTNTARGSEALRHCPPFQQKWMDLYVQQWKASGFVEKT